MVSDNKASVPRGEPDLSFLQLPVARTLDIPGLAGDGDTPAHANDGKTLTVGKDVTFSGEIITCDTLIVEGTVAATLASGRAVEIVRSGSFKGSARVDTATISGRFDGELVVDDLLRVTATGYVTGTVRYGRLEVEVGGQVNGDVATTDANG